MPSTTLRTFIAVKVPATRPLRPVLAEFETMGRAVRAVAADGLHVTLKFLGDTRQDAVAEIEETLRAVVAETAAFDVRLVGLGAFPHAGRPSAVWAGIQDAEPLTEIAAELERALEPLGFAAEQRAFQPHLTLARVKSKPPPALGELLSAHAATEFGG
ncbi:MAG: RNA 2',3'-cyclic phosphodiesterase, partial [Planctomycetaceae bacterium]